MSHIIDTTGLLYYRNGEKDSLRNLYARIWTRSTARIMYLGKNQVNGPPIKKTTLLPEQNKQTGNGPSRRPAQTSKIVNCSNYAEGDYCERKLLSK